MISGQNVTRARDRATPGNDKRAAILQAAWALIRHYGYDKTTIQDIADKAGVGKGTVYLYFRSKAEIMLGLVDLTNERIAADLEAIADGDEAPEERLRRCLLHRVMTIYDLVRRHPHGAEVIQSMKPEIVRRIGRHVNRHGEILEGILAEGVEAGVFVVNDAADAGALLAGLFELLTPPYYRFASRRALERFAEQAADLLIAGLRNGSVGTVRSARAKKQRSRRRR